MTGAVVVFSGGLDSTVTLYEALVVQRFDTRRVIAVSFNYGQRHKKELNFAADTCKALGIQHLTIDLWKSGLTEALSVSGSSLVSDTDVPEGHYGEDNMKSTVVPNRNMIMLSIAGGIMVANGFTELWTGVHAGDHFIYPDCRPRFIWAAGAAISLGNAGFGALPEVGDDVVPAQIINTPFIYSTKADIAYRALELAIPLHRTWSCYNGDDIHCGKCGTCVERLEAIEEAVKRYEERFHPAERNGVEHYDLTEYADRDYWREAIAKGI